MKYTKEQQKENRAKWVKALRSGKYEQAKGALRDKANSYCCLGVLCTVAGIKPVKKDGVWLFEEDCTVAPPTAQDFVGLRTEGGLFWDEKTSSLQALWKLNDLTHTFDEIADIIESEPKDLFND